MVAHHIAAAGSPYTVTSNAVSNITTHHYSYWYWGRACPIQSLLKVKIKVWTLAIAPLTWVRLVTSSALQSRKWQLIGMSQWCRSALC